MMTLEQELVEQIHQLDAAKQQRVLEYVRAINNPTGTPFGEVQRLARELAFGKEDLDEIIQYIEDNFEQVRGDELDAPDFST
jgi:hypothetical protein